MMMNDKICTAMGYLEPAMVQEAAQTMARKRKRLRPLLVAACLVTMLSVMVVASEFMGNEQWKIRFWTEAPVNEQFEVEATYGGTALKSAGAAELKKAVEEGRKFITSDGMMNIVHDAIRSFENLAELEDYLGVDLLETPLKPVEDCHIVAFYNPEEDDALYVDVYYRGEQLEEGAQSSNLQINAYICTVKDVTLSILSTLPEKKIIQEYPIKRLGVMAYLVQKDQVCRGYFNVEGIAYEVLMQGDVKALQSALETFEK